MNPRGLALPAWFTTLRELRRELARGALPSSDKRTAEESLQLSAFRVLQEWLRLVDDFRRRVESSERCRLVEREHRPEPGRLVIEIGIEVQS
jgi:hypothetical protein